jgi:hypothetical protein
MLQPKRFLFVLGAWDSSIERGSAARHKDMCPSASIGVPSTSLVLHQAIHKLPHDPCQVPAFNTGKLCNAYSSTSTDQDQLE